MKKIVFFMLCFFVGCFSVSAKEIRFYFYPNGGVVNTENFEVSSYGYLHYNDSYYARYDTDDSIPNINSISNVTFSVVKNGDSLVSGREWYTQVNDQKYFLSESKAYSVEALFEQIGSTNDSVYSLDLYANWSSLKIDGVDISTTSNSNISSTTSEGAIVKFYGMKDTSILIGSQDGKYALYDAGYYSSGNCSGLIKKVKKDTGSQGLKYLILSHSDTDHIACASSVVNSVSVENVILKNESLYFYRYKDVIEVSKKRKTKVIYSNNLSEGKDVSLGTAKIFLYNVKDIFDGNAKCKNGSLVRRGTAVKYYNLSGYNKKDNLAMTTDNKVVKIVGSSRKIELESVSSAKKKFDAFHTYRLNNDKSEMKKYMDLDLSGFGQFQEKYAIFSKNRVACSSNSNSIVLLVQFPTSTGNKYAYLTGDVDNNGYPGEGLLDDDYGMGIYSQGTSHMLATTEVSGKTKLIMGGNHLKTSSYNVKYPAEVIATNRIATKLGNDKKNIVIFQAPHHGYNVFPHTIKTLNLNNSSVYVVATGATGSEYLYHSSGNLRLRGYYEYLSKVSKSGHYWGSYNTDDKSVSRVFVIQKNGNISAPAKAAVKNSPVEW